MGITCQLKQVTSSTLNLLQQNPLLVDLFFAVQCFPDSTYFQQLLRDRHQYISHHDLSVLEQKFLSEWEIPALKLYKNFSELTFLTAGYVPGYTLSEWTIPELKPLAECSQNQWTLPFLVIEESQWDGCSLVNAIDAATEFEYPKNLDNNTIYCSTCYFSSHEVGQILDGFLLLSKECFEERYRRESKKPYSLAYLDEFDEETMNYLANYFDSLNDYYEDAVRRKNGMLIDYSV